MPYTIDNFPGKGTSAYSTTDELLLAVLNAVDAQGTASPETPFELVQELTIVGGAYTAGDYVGISGGTLNFTTAADNGHLVELRSVRLYSDDTTNSPQYRIHWFKTSPPAQTDNNPFSISYADAAPAFRKRHTMPVMEKTVGHGYSEDFTNWIEIQTADNDNKIYFLLQTLVTGNINVGAKLKVAITGFTRAV